MMKHPATVAPVLALVLAVTLPVFGGLRLTAGEVVEQVLVKVNGEIISKSEFEQRQVAAIRTRPEFADGNAAQDEIKKALLEITPDLILAIVDEMLLIQRGRELGYALGDQQFQGIVDNIKKENKLESEEDFQAALKQENMTMADLRRNMERNMLVSRVQQQEVADKIGVTDDEAKAYYAEHMNEFTTPADISLREILIEVPVVNGATNVAQDEEAKAEAEDIRKRLIAGEPFPRLAADHSDSPSKANGGLIGPFKRTDLSPALLKMIDGLKAGDVSEPLRVARGYQLFRLEEKTAERVLSFDNARGAIADRVAQEKQRVELQKYLSQQRAQAIITWRNDDLKKAYEQALAKRQAVVAPAAPPAN
jgi:peptidyl-prolyl cis-trans isomerase SurA